jgi:hypothetical protein
VQNFIKWHQTAPITDVQPLNIDVLLNFVRLHNHNADEQVIETACRKNRTEYQVTNYIVMTVQEVARYTNIHSRCNIWKIIISSNPLVAEVADIANILNNRNNINIRNTSGTELQT